MEQLLCRSLLNAAETTSPTTFRPSAAVQQIFSLLKQSPTGALRLRPLAEGVLSEADIEAILGELQVAGNGAREHGSMNWLTARINLTGGRGSLVWVEIDIRSSAPYNALAQCNPFLSGENTRYVFGKPF